MGKGRTHLDPLERDGHRMANIMEEVRPVVPRASEVPDAPDVITLKAAVAALAVIFIAAPVAYGAYEINNLSTPGIAVWRWPVIAALGVAFVALAWWVVMSIRRNFPCS